MFSLFEIAGDCLIQVCLSLEGYVERFLHLPGVDALMSFLYRSYGALSSGEEDPKEIDIAESRWRDEPVSYYLHWRMN